MEENGTGDVEITRRLIDLFFVSVLLDAGAGDCWHFLRQKTARNMRGVKALLLRASICSTLSPSPTQTQEARPQSIVCAPFEHLISIHNAKAFNRAGKGLKNMTTEKLMSGFQVSDENPMLGIDCRAALLRRLGESLLDHPDAFGEEGRPGNLVGKRVFPMSY